MMKKIKITHVLYIPFIDIALEILNKWDYLMSA
jgi:hypothetical protein